jgi:hypothetical protein
MIERLWSIALPKNKGIAYAIGYTRNEAWQNACAVLFNCWRPEMIDEMKKEGYRAIRVDVIYTLATVKKQL